MPLEKFANLKILFDGTKLRFITSIEVAKDGGKIPVNILEEGLAGFSKGSGGLTVTIGIAVPLAGLEWPFLTKIDKDEDVAMQVIIGGDQIVQTGQLTTGNINQSVDSATEGSIVWTGPGGSGPT